METDPFRCPLGLFVQLPLRPPARSPPGDPAALEDKLAQLSADLASGLSAEGLTTRCIALKLKAADFTLFCRQVRAFGCI